MKIKMIVIAFTILLFLAGSSFGADDQASFGTQAGEAARELSGTANETISTGAAKVAESTQKVQTEAEETLKTLREQWDAFTKQLQEKTQQLQKQLQQQWQDFNKSFNQPSK